MNRREFLSSSASVAIATGAFVSGAAPALAQDRYGPARDWDIGPFIRGRNYSVGMPAHPTASGRGWFFDFPGPRRRDGHVHYVTRQTGPLDMARGIRMRYRIDARRGARFVPQEHPDQPATLSLYFQQAGDDWSGRGDGRFARWYSPRRRQFPLTPGEHEITVMFDENWLSVMGSDRASLPREFARALANAGRVGITFGSRRARGHGVFATAPARFTLLDFRVI